MMITVPVFSPRRELKWTKPPDVLTGIDTLGEPGFQVEKAINEGLHVKTINEPDGAQPKKTCPTENEVTKGD